MKLKVLHNYFQSHPEGMWIMRWPNAVKLYEFIKENNIHKILTLGTGIGCSDAVICLAMQDKGEKNYHIDSVEQYDKCIKIAKELIPEEFLKNITIQKSEPKVWSTSKMPYQYFSIYESLPEGDYDLIINDGPAPFMEGENYIDLLNGTIHKLLLENKIKAGTKIVYDGRVRSFNLLERFFSNNFYLVSIPPRGNDFYVIERKDNEICLGDDLSEAIKTHTTYFKNHKKDENIIPGNQQGASAEAKATP